jgi:hypothetical protein
MKLFRSDLLTLLISLFILSAFSSCKNQSDVGLPVGSQEINGTLISYDDLTIKTDTENTQLAYDRDLGPKVPLASLRDPRLGTTNGNIALNLSLPGNAAYTIPSGKITADSVVLELRYADGFYGDSLSSRYKVNVYQLNDRLAGTISSYYTSTLNPHATTNLVNTAKAGPYNVRPRTAVKVTNIVKGGKDTVAVTAPHLRVSLQPAFFSNMLFNTTNAASVVAFQRALKGLYIEIQRNQPNEIGGSLMLNMAASNMKVYYRADTAGTIDTAVATLPVTVAKAEITHSYSDEVKAAIAGTASNNAFYIQGLTGLRAKIAFPNLKTIFGNVDLKTIAINRAELVITPVAGTEVIPFAPQTQLTLYRLDITKQRTLIPDANGTSAGPVDGRFTNVAAFGGNYFSDKKEYRFLVTGYLDDLLRGKTVDYGTYIGAIDNAGFFGRANSQGGFVQSVDIQPTAETAGRLIAVGTDKNSPYRIKLNIIYTKNN